MSENVSAGREARDGVNTNVPQAAPVHVDTPALASVRRRLVAKDLSPEVKMLNDKKVVGVSNSPVMFSSTLKFLYGRDACHDSGKSEQDSNVSRTESQEKETKSSKFEWVEQYEPGVYITFTKLSNGQKALKRVRFR